MQALRHRLGLDADPEAGLSIVEVVVAMFIFAIIATGSIYAMLDVLQVTRDSRSQQVAANLAAQDIDLARDYDDLFKLLPTTYDVPLNGDTFKVTRETEWVGANGNDVKCGSGGATLSYKRVNVTVTWENMRSGSNAVRSDTVLDPQNRISDPTKGTILVFVKKDSGAGSPGLTIEAKPSSNPNGAVTPSPNTAVTDLAGCGYILRVQPGNYDISVSSSSDDFVDQFQQTTAIKNLGVAANSTASVGFQFDKAGQIEVRYAKNYTGSPAPILPNELLTTFSTTYGDYAARPEANGKFLLHPFATGYQVIAGQSAECAAMDPREWTSGGLGYISPSVPIAKVVADSANNTADASMGVIKVKTTLALGNQYLRAVSVNSAGKGQPGCAEAVTYRFGKVLPAAGGEVAVALPYGTWKLYADSSGVVNGTVNSVLGLTGVTTTVLTKAGISGVANTVTLDPRTVAGTDADEADDGTSDYTNCTGKHLNHKHCEKDDDDENDDE